MAGQPSTRAEWLRAMGQRYKLALDLDFGCDACRETATLTELKRAGSVRCPRCSGTTWSVRAVFRGGDQKHTQLDASTALSFALGVATGGEVLLGGATADDPGVRIWERFREPGVDARELTDLVAMKPKQRREALLTFLHARELNRNRRLKELLETDAVDCLTCRRPFVPTVALERHEVLGDTGQGDDTTCSNRCGRLLREALTQQVCPVCRKVFVPPPRPAIDRDWAPKEWHVAGYCTRSCFEGRERLRVCHGCRENFVIPEPNPLAKHPKKPKRWHEAGFCSKKCQDGADRFQDCGACGKRYLPPAPSKLSKQKPKPWHLAGFCSKSCRDDPAPAAAAPAQAPARTEARCAAGHAFPVPATHAGLRTTCPECRERLVV